MSDSIDDFQPINEPETLDSRRHRRHAMTMLVQILVHVSSRTADPQDAKHRIAISQFTTFIGNLTGRIAEADDRTFAAIMTEASTLVRGLQNREAERERETLH